MSTKKFFLGVAMVALLVGVSFTPVKADTLSDLNAQIQVLMAQISALSGGMTPPATSGYVFTTDLTIGSTGADVTALQNALISNGQSIPAGATGYFGAQTKAAVIAWQKEAGLPATGFFGPMSRAAMNAMPSSGPGSTGYPPYVPPVSSGPCSGGEMYNSMTGALCSTGLALLPAGCTSTAGFSPLTGASCSSSVAPLPAGCTTATGFSVTTGQSCSTGTGGATAGTEGSITTRLGTTPTPDTNIRRTTDVPVYGVEVEAVSSDMTVDRADLQFAVTTWDSTTSFGTGSVQNPGAFIKNIKAWDGSTQLGSWDVSASSFSKDSSDRYHIILSGLGSRVTKGMKKNITFSVSVSSIGTTDVPRRVAVQGYAGNTQNIRATDSVGLQSYADMSGSANTRTHDFKAAGNATLTVTTNSAATPKAGNTRINSTTGITKKIMQAFDARAETGDAKITKLYVGTNATSSTGVPSTYYLCDGSDTTCASPLYSVTAGATDNLEAAFTSMSILVAP